jgi:hypothetical protein
LSDEGILQKSARNQFPPIATMKAFIEWREREIRAEYEATDCNAASYEKHRARLYKEKADKAAMENDLMRGTLHEASAIASVMNEMLAAFRQRVLAIPTKTAPLTADCTSPVECYAIIETECHQALSELADYDPRPVVERQRAAVTKPEEDESAD